MLRYGPAQGPKERPVIARRRPGKPMTRALALLCPLALAACKGGLEPQIEVNPACDLSAIVRWSTAEPASSWVELGPVGEPALRVGSDSLSTEHEVVVVGMWPDDAFELLAVSTTQDGDELRSEPMGFETGSLPEPWLTGELSVNQTDAVQPGWTIANIFIAAVSPVVAVMLDEQGRTTWYHIHDGEDGAADIQVSWIDQTRELLVGPHVAPEERSFQISLTGEISWQGPEQTGSPGHLNIQDGQLHHVLTRLSNGDTLSVRSSIRDVDGDEVQGDVVVQLSWDNQEVWSWDTFEHIEYSPESVYMGLWWTHVNSVDVDLDQDVAYVNSWVQGQLWKVDRSSGEILWTLGEQGDFAADPHHDDPWFAYAHSFDAIGPGRFLVYDNGSMQRARTRVLEYQLDEDTMQAEIVWEWPPEGHSLDWFTVATGDVDLLDNGNRLITAETTLLEVSEAGDLVWRFDWAELDHQVRSYQSARIPALAQPL